MRPLPHPSPALVLSCMEHAVLPSLGASAVRSSAEFELASNPEDPAVAVVDVAGRGLGSWLSSGRERVRFSQFVATRRTVLIPRCHLPRRCRSATIERRVSVRNRPCVIARFSSLSLSLSLSLPPLCLSLFFSFNGSSTGRDGRARALVSRHLRSRVLPFAFF